MPQLSRHLARHPARYLTSYLLTALLLGCTAQPAQLSTALPPADSGVGLVNVFAGLDDPWGMDFLPDGDLLVTEKSGRLLRLDTVHGTSTPVSGVPVSVSIGQGGLLDVLVSPEYATDGWIYLSYVVAGKGGYATRIARAQLHGATLDAIEVLYTARPYVATKRHFGSRLLLAQGYLYFSLGERGDRHQAQSLASFNGKVMRVYPDGSVPADNPFVNVDGALPEIWTYGHRNPQGIAQDPRDGSIWVSEHGPQGGDELNRLLRGANYGWPVITYGEEYGGGKIGLGTEQAGMEQPLKYYLPSIGTGGIAFYMGDRYPGWGNSLLICALRLAHLNRLTLTETGFADEYRLFDDSALRFRDVQPGPDGYVYALVGGDRVVKLVPAAESGG